MTDYLSTYHKIYELLAAFGAPSSSIHPEYPIWRLQQDRLWEVLGAEAAVPRQGNTNPLKSELDRINPAVGFTEPVYQLLQDQPSLLIDEANRILSKSFPETLHEDILCAVGLERRLSTRRQKSRDSGFREKVLVAYEYRCGICGFDVRLGTIPLGLEAAHIKWHQANGPDIEQNGIAMCSIHHKLFDLGAFTILDTKRVVVSEKVTGSSGFSETLLAYHDRRLLGPQRESYAPRPEYLGWHFEEVFHAPAR